MIELSNSTSIRINESVFEKKNGDGKQKSTAPLRQNVTYYEFAITPEPLNEKLTGFSGVGTTKSGRKGLFSIDFHEVKQIEFM